MSRLQYIVVCCLLSAITPGKSHADSGDVTAPNILLILVDDVGYADIGAFSARINNTTLDKLYYETPRIDQLAKDGVMFTQFYAATVCAPSRASLLTGKMPNRMGFWDAYAFVETTYEKTGKTVPEGGHILDHEPWEEYDYNKTDRGVSIPTASTALHDVRTIPQGLEGYDTAFIGKWHLGSHNHEGHRPEDHGFDETLAYFDGGGSSYHRPFKVGAGATPEWDKPGPDLTPEQDYLSDDIAQRVNVYLEDRAANHQNKPFFLYLAHPSAHSPIQSRADDLAYFQEKNKNLDLVGHREPEYAGLIRGLDRSIGEILDTLDELNLADNTAVIFISDNGGHPTFTRNTPLRGGKSMLYEGGIRVPMIVRWPGKTKAGAVSNVPSSIEDIYPTVMEIAGVGYSDFKADPATDGQSIKSLFTDLTNEKKAYTRDAFYHFYGKIGYTGFHNFATWATLRQGDYKLHYDYQGKVELYNIAADITESNDLVGAKPQLALDLLVQLTDWLEANNNAAYLPVPNPDFDPQGELPYGPYVPLEQLKATLADLKVETYATGRDQTKVDWSTHIAFGPGDQEIVTDLRNNRFLYRAKLEDSFHVSPVSVRGQHSVVYNPADGLYYANDTENHRIISFADLSSGTLTAQTKNIAGIPLQRPHDIVVDPATGWIYAINPNSGHVFRFTAIGENESAITVPVQGYARALTFANGKLYAIGSSKGRIVEIVDWDNPTFTVYDSFDPTGHHGPAGSWTKTGLVLNDADFFDGYWYASSYFTKSYADGTDFDENKFIRFKTLDDLVAGSWTDLSNLVPSGMTPYYLTVKGDKLYLAIFNHESPGSGDCILQFTRSKLH